MNTLQKQKREHSKKSKNKRKENKRNQEKTKKEQENSNKRIHIIDFKKKRIKAFTNEELCEFANEGNFEAKERYLLVENERKAIAVLEYLTS